ncbi:hypothetical protein CHN50_15625 [Priestia aryabhattai]|uniref:hypothetical protein n=1 Tax=Priestia flexa TaxID=86664 RepID=UPI000BA0780C|nr:hypothetical protein CHN50_15625 [Priestia aryabhattai]USY54053.1 hypothetical protein NIZ91_15020 [Bacillus sp. 1780r2a1]
MYYYHYYNPCFQQQMNRQPQSPPVDTSIFSHSVNSLQKIVLESSVLLKKLADPKFSQTLMTAAQAGNHKQVDNLIKSIGISTPITTKYNPDGLLLIMPAQSEGKECCALSMFLKWGEFRGYNS